MITEILNRLEVLAGMSDLDEDKLENEKVVVEEAGGISEDTWNAMTRAEKREYIERHPNSRFNTSRGGSKVRGDHSSSRYSVRKNLRKKDRTIRNYDEVKHCPRGGCKVH